jgi:flavin reductase (DIM6/NTAB) family NADH-FMN oxidoreductase RutF
MDDTAAATLFAWLDREVWLVTARAGERRGGLVATFVSQASLSPDAPRVLVGLAPQHHTQELIAQSGSFALHLLCEENLDLVWRFGLASGHDVDKFAGLVAGQGPTGSPLLEAAVGWLDCRVEASLDTGGRVVHVAEVVEGKAPRRAGPRGTPGRAAAPPPPRRLPRVRRHPRLARLPPGEVSPLAARRAPR